MPTTDVRTTLLALQLGGPASTLIDPLLTLVERVELLEAALHRGDMRVEELQQLALAQSEQLARLQALVLELRFANKRTVEALQKWDPR